MGVCGLGYCSNPGQDNEPLIQASCQRPKTPPLPPCRSNDDAHSAASCSTSCSQYQ